jgi:N-acetylmuramic acid 6-phosphate (MurNAc-6-P) etherase
MSTLYCAKTTENYKMLTLEQIRAKLQDRRLNLISKATGIHANTLREVRDNSQANPTYKVIKLLNDYFSGTLSNG